MAEGEITTFSALTEKFNLPPGNYKKPKLLYCSNGGHFLRILPDGTVDGTRDRSDQHSKQPSLLWPLVFLVAFWCLEGGDGRISKHKGHLLCGSFQATRTQTQGKHRHVRCLGMESGGLWPTERDPFQDFKGKDSVGLTQVL